MTLTELRYLVALHRERHFGRAADRVFVSQPTLSVALRKLEEELGVTLFERSRREARPTPIGERIISQAERVLQEAEMLTSIAERGRDELKGPLRLGAIYTVGPYLLPHLIPVLRESTPEMPLVIEENFTVELSRQLRQNELDAILIALPFSQPGVETWALYDEPFVVVLPRGHDWSTRQAITPNDLSHQDLLLLGPGHCFRDQVLEACPDCEDHAIDGERPRAGSSLETIRHMVASGLGITVLPQSSTCSETEEQPLLVTRPFTDDSPSRRIALAWRSSFPRPKAIAAVRNAILACGMPGVNFLDRPAGDNTEALQATPA